MGAIALAVAAAIESDIFEKICHALMSGAYSRKKDLWMKRLLPVVVLLLLVGCSDEKETVSSAKDSNEVVLSVNGYALTKGQLDARAEMMLKLKQLQNPAMKVAEVGKVRKDLVATYPKFFIEQALWAQYAKDEKVKVDKRVLERVRSRAVQSATGKKGMKYGALRAKFGTLGPVLDEHVQMMALTSSAKRHLCDANPTNIPPEFASNMVKRVQNYNASVTLTNALIYARATNCWEKLKAGADFIDMVLEYSELEQERRDKGEWGTLDLQQLEPDEQLYNFVKQHSPGDFSPPLEGDNGLMILRIDGRKDAECTLSRIYFQLPMFAQELTAEQILKQEREKYNNRLIEKKYKELKKSAKIVKPKAKKAEDGKNAKSKAKKGKSKKLREKALSPDELKALKERQAAEEKLREAVKAEVFSGTKPKSEPPKSGTKISK